MSFSEELRLATLNITEKVDADRKAITLELFNSVILDTPVDTGRARGNWQTTKNTPAGGQIERLDPGGGQATQEAAEQVLSSISDGTLYLTNNLPYIMPLEYGHSAKQAPTGMVRKNLSRITQILRERANKR